YDDTMPEEINRKVADVCSKLYFVPTKQSAINLALEGISREKIFITGNTIVDACFRHIEIAENRENIDETLKNLLKLDNILTLTIHRAENTDEKQRLENIIKALVDLKEYNIIFPIHPRTTKKLKEFNLYEDFAKNDHIHIVEPLGYLDFLLLMSKSKLILTDSGGLQEEAITLNIPVLTLRYNTERPETVSAGGNILVGADTDKITDLANVVLNNKDFAGKMKEAKNPYGNGDTGEKIINIIENSQKEGTLEIKSPEEIMTSFKSNIKQINEEISVKEFEEKYNSRIRIVYNKNSIEFPEDDLSLFNKLVFFDSYSS
ncbi:MAG: UDP-N-acetylglucosamine 2-epimerase (non-hydrolyzing), partial [Methanobrevibacter sp.]|nr:UDP-N-acetylglucosamine 2-epimerase (non-hydrolyzing) [Methanobrevibacter sp.]